MRSSPAPGEPGGDRVAYVLNQGNRSMMPTDAMSWLMWAMVAGLLVRACQLVCVSGVFTGRG